MPALKKLDKIGRLEISTLKPVGQDYFETCVFDEGSFPRRSKVVGTYPDADYAAVAHSALVQAIGFILNPNERSG